MKPVLFKRRRAVGTLLATLAAAAFASAPAMAQDYPSRTISLVVPYGAGGGTDQLARIIATKLQERLGETVIVVNKPGAGTVIGSEFVANSPPDGYTLYLATSGLSSTPAMVANVPFDPVKDFTPIAPVATMLIVFDAYPGVPADTIPELVKYMKANPGKLNYASYGVATTNNLSMILFNKSAGVKSVGVPYKGAAAAMPDLITGKVQLVLDSMATSAPFLKSGKLKALAVGSAKRSAYLPDVPTMAESGFPDFNFEPYYGILGPAGMPEAIVARLNKEINAVLGDPEVREAMRKQYLTPTPGTPEQLGQTVRKEIDFWLDAARTAGIEPE